MMLVRFIRFTLVGGFATGIQYVVLVLLVQNGGSNPVAASAAGFVISAFVNYIVNYHYTFGSSQPHYAAVAKFAVLAGLGLLLNSLIMAALVHFGLHYLGAQIAATVTVLLWNFAGNSLWTFRNSAPLPERRLKRETVMTRRRARAIGPGRAADASRAVAEQAALPVPAAVMPGEGGNTGEPMVASTREWQ